jgi:hypothetical protein
MRTLNFLFLSLIISTPAVHAAQVNVFTQANNAQRTGANLQEKILNTTNVHIHFGLLWKLYSDAKIMAQPLYASNLKSAKCANGCNTVIFCSMKGTVYAYMADQKPQTVNDTLVWARYLGDPRPGGKDIDMWSTDDPWWGILGTPVIDPATNSLYVVAWKSDYSYNLYNLDLASGSIKAGPVVIHGGVAGKTFDDVYRKQRAGLLLDRGMLYVAFGGDVMQIEQGKSAGWIFVYDAKHLALQTIWTPTLHGTNAGIWQSGRGLAADANGFIYVVTGDGDFDAGQEDFGDSILKLRLARTPAGSPTPEQISVADFFTPCDQALLKKDDRDLGSGGPLLFGNQILAGGKEGRLYTMNRNKMGKFKAPPSPDAASCTNDTARVNDFQATSGGHIHGSPIYWEGPNGAFVYVWGESDHLHEYPIVNGVPQPQNAKNSVWGIPDGSSVNCPTKNVYWMPGGILSLSADGSRSGTGIVWAIVTATGDANACRGVKGMLMAFDAEDVSHELWRSQQMDPALDTPDSFGLVSRFAAPTIANGKVFVETAGDREPLHLYGGTDHPTQFPGNYYLAVYGVK